MTSQSQSYFWTDAVEVLLLRLYEALLGRTPEPAAIRQYHFAVTVLYLFMTIVLCRCLRLVNSYIIPQRLRPLLSDVISTFQTISCGFENGFVRKVYGMGAYCCQTLCLGLWASWTFAPNSSGNPVTNFKHFFVRKYGALRTLIHMSSQMIAGLVAYQYARFFWSFELSQEHLTALAGTENCSTDLNVPVVLGLFVELSATIIDTVVSRTTTKRFMFERYEQFAKGIFSIWMTILGLNLTGMYLNPANATARNFGCRGVSKTEFILVYWMGPIIGSAIGIVIHQNFSRALHLMTSQLDSQSQSRKSAAEMTSQLSSQSQPRKSADSSHTDNIQQDNNSQDFNSDNSQSAMRILQNADQSKSFICDKCRLTDDSGFVDGCQCFKNSSFKKGCQIVDTNPIEKKTQ